MIVLKILWFIFKLAVYLVPACLFFWWTMRLYEKESEDQENAKHYQTISFCLVVIYILFALLMHYGFGLKVLVIG